MTLERAAPWSPIWPCSRWGFPCLLDYSRSGGLLPRLFTLAANTQLAAVYSLWHCPSKSLSAFLPRVSHPNKHELRGIAPSGVRTFLPGFAPEAILRPSKINLKLPAYLRDDKFRHRAKRLPSARRTRRCEPTRTTEQRSSHRPCFRGHALNLCVRTSCPAVEDQVLWPAARRNSEVARTDL